MIVTSDTAPISRIFLTRLNELHGRLIVYLSNRFDTGMRKDEQENEAYTRELHKATYSTSKIKWFLIVTMISDTLRERKLSRTREKLPLYILLVTTLQMVLT